MGLGSTRCGSAQYRVYRDLLSRRWYRGRPDLLLTTRWPRAGAFTVAVWRVTHMLKTLWLNPDFGPDRCPGWLRRKQGGWSAGSAARAVSDNCVQDLMSLAQISVRMGLGGHHNVRASGLVLGPSQWPCGGCDPCGFGRCTGLATMQARWLERGLGG